MRNRWRPAALAMTFAALAAPAPAQSPSWPELASSPVGAWRRASLAPDAPWAGLFAPAFLSLQGAVQRPQAAPVRLSLAATDPSAPWTWQVSSDALPPIMLALPPTTVPFGSSGFDGEAEFQIDFTLTPSFTLAMNGQFMAAYPAPQSPHAALVTFLGDPDGGQITLTLGLDFDITIEGELDGPFSFSCDIDGDLDGSIADLVNATENFTPYLLPGSVPRPARASAPPGAVTETVTGKIDVCGIDLDITVELVIEPMVTLDVQGDSIVAAGQTATAGDQGFVVPLVGGTATSPAAWIGSASLGGGLMVSGEACVEIFGAEVCVNFGPIPLELPAGLTTPLAVPTAGFTIVLPNGVRSPSWRLYK